MRLDHALMLAGVLLILAGVFGCGWYLSYRHYAPVAVVETPAMPIDHGDGSTTMARTVDYKPTTKAPTLPKGGKVIATAEVVVKPDPPVAGDCLPVTVRVDVTESTDGGLRASERVTGGETIEAVHYAPPVRYVRPDRKWAAGVAYSDGDYALAIDYDMPALRIGAAVSEDYQGVRFLFRF